jgi:hypothetical protein
MDYKGYNKYEIIVEFDSKQKYSDKIELEEILSEQFSSYGIVPPYKGNQYEPFATSAIHCRTVELNIFQKKLLSDQYYNRDLDGPAGYFGVAKIPKTASYDPIVITAYLDDKEYQKFIDLIRTIRPDGHFVRICVTIVHKEYNIARLPLSILDRDFKFAITKLDVSAQDKPVANKYISNMMLKSKIECIIKVTSIDAVARFNSSRVSKGYGAYYHFRIRGSFERTSQELSMIQEDEIFTYITELDNIFIYDNNSVQKSYPKSAFRGTIIRTKNEKNEYSCGIYLHATEEELKDFFHTYVLNSEKKLSYERLSLIIDAAVRDEINTSDHNKNESETEFLVTEFTWELKLGRNF